MVKIKSLVAAQADLPDHLVNQEQTASGLEAHFKWLEA